MKTIEEVNEFIDWHTKVISQYTPELQLEFTRARTKFLANIIRKLKR